MTTRHQNRGLRKVCTCARRSWAKCPHSWHFNFKLPGGPGYRFSIDAEAGKHVESKTQAEALADGYRIAIRAGTFRRRVEAPAAPAATPAPEVLTLGAFFERYAERVTRPLSTNDRGCLAQLLAFEDLRAKPLASITEDDIEAFFWRLRAAGRAASTRNKHVQAVTAMFRWAAKKGYLPRSPIADSDSIRREKLSAPVIEVRRMPK